MKVVTLLAALLLGGSLPACLHAAVTERSAEATADPTSFFDTVMSFLGSSALHQHQPAEGDGDDTASTEAKQEASEQAEQGRSLYGADLDPLTGGPDQDGGQADRVKRTGQIPAQILSGVINHKLGYLHKGAQHIHYHNYNTKCEKPHFSLWEFKKAILHKLLEAAKAIGGGVLAIKGKLLTAKGHLVAANGRKLATKGEELTEFGKSVLAKALGHGGHEVHSVPSAPSAPSGPSAAFASAHYSAPVYGAPAPGPAYGYNYPPAPGPQYQPPQPSAHGYDTAVSLLNEYNRAGFAPHAHAHAHGQAYVGANHRSGMAPTGPSATGPAGTRNAGNLQAGLLVVQAAPSAPQRSGHVAPAPFSPSASAASYSPQDASTQAASQPLVLAPEYMDTVMAVAETNKVRRDAVAAPIVGSRQSLASLDSAMATVVRGLQGSDVLLHPDIIKSAVARLVVP